MNKQVKKTKKRRIPELLAPAGNKEAFIAAVESGADAVYFGGEMLNARMGAGNFSLSEMKEAIDFAHKRNVKTYVTVNTLVKDSEMNEALSYCKKLYELGADALIIQDLGLGYALKKMLPGFPLHLSTQGSIYDLNGVLAAKKLGYERVVLARELSLKEIKEICSFTDMEIEVFTHGALCICYSGQCQMSRAIGARSGNRGACAQPCRLPYEMLDGKSWSQKKYYLSPADLNLIDYIGELAEAGVSSLKIEGRMKSPEYVSVVISIYRKYLDEYLERGNYEVSAEDRMSLLQIFNRGFNTGYMEGADKHFMSGDSPKNKGVHIGEVSAVESIKGKSDRKIIGAVLNSTVEKGDVLEIGSDAHSTVTLLEGNYPYIRLGDVIGEVRKGDAINRVLSRKQIDLAEKSYKNKDWHQGKYERKTVLTCDVISKEDGSIRVVLRDKLSGKAVEVESECFDYSASVDARERMETALKKTGGTPFAIPKIDFRGSFDLAIPVSKINELRRNALAMMEDALTKTERKTECNLDLGSLLNANGIEKNQKVSPEFYFFNAEDFLCSKRVEKQIRKSVECFTDVTVILPAVQAVDYYTDICNRCEELKVEFIPYISNISKGSENRKIEECFDRICDIAKESGIYIGNLNWIERLVACGITVYGDYGLNSYNAWTDEALSCLGVNSVIGSLENYDIGSGYYGRAPLMTSEHEFYGDALRDRKGKEYDIVSRPFSDQDLIVLSQSESPWGALSAQQKEAAKEGERPRVYI